MIHSPVSIGLKRPLLFVVECLPVISKGTLGILVSMNVNQNYPNPELFWFSLVQINRISN